MTAAATRDPRYCEAVCQWSMTSPPRCRRQKWQVTPATATQLAWTTRTTHVHVHVGGPRHAPGWSAAVHGSGGHRAITLTVTAGENCRTQTRLIESRTSPGKFIPLPGNLFIRELTTLIQIGFVCKKTQAISSDQGRQTKDHDLKTYYRTNN